MNISECFDFINFWANKVTGQWYTISELTQIVDRGQMSLYADIQPKYATSQHIKDALAPFRSSYTFGYNDTLNGVITIPSNTNYLNLLDCHIEYDISARSITKQVGIAMVNEDQRANRLDSQIDPVAATSPIGEMIGARTIQLYPKVQYRGVVTFLRRPVAPVFGYSVISGSVIVYDPNTSTQLEWSEEWQNAVLIKALSSIGINLQDGQIAQYAQLKTQENWVGQNRV